jgi:hypothetical protein
MADGSVEAVAPAGAQSKIYKALTLKEVDRFHECEFQVRGILMLLRNAAESDADILGDAIIGPCWAAERLVEEMRQIATSKGGQNNG